MIARSTFSRSWLVGLAALVAAGALAAPAAAQTDFKFALSSANPKVTWDGSEATAVNVTNQLTGEPTCGKTPIDYCDIALFEVLQPGTLALKGVMANALTDVDFYLFKSDAAATQGAAIESETDGQGAGADEVITTVAEAPGFYLLKINFFTTLGPSYAGEAAFTVDPSAPPLAGATPPPTTTPPPTAANVAPKSVISAGAKSAKSRKIKKFSGTATDSDGSVSKVQIALLKVKGSKCVALTSSGGFKPSQCSPPKSFVTAKGTASWSYTLKKKLTKGKYVLYSRATDNAGLAESKFGSKNRKRFTVR